MRFVTLKRVMPQCRSNVKEQIDYILSVALRGKREAQQGWVCQKKTVTGPENKNGLWESVATLVFEKTKGQRGGDAEFKQWDELVEMIVKAGSHSKFSKYPWKLQSEQVPSPGDYPIEGDEPVDTEEGKPGKIPGVKETKKVLDDVHEILVPDIVLTIPDLRAMFPHDLLHDQTGAAIENHKAFKGIYGRAHIIRLILSGIWAFIESEGEMSPHTLLWGPPACAKTRLLRGIEELFGPGAFLNLDATNTTRPGLEKLIFEKLERVPPFIKMEEIEKADESTLAMWLGAMDERREFRKVNFHKTRVRQVEFMGFGTVNDKQKFDKMMNSGSKDNEAGALSSRFSQQWLCPRPSTDEMRLILKREVKIAKGDEAWIEPCMELADEIGTDDPRKVISFLAGRERLLSGHYQEDMRLCLSREPRGIRQAQAA